MSQRRRNGVSAWVAWLTQHPVLLPVFIVLVGGIFRFYNLNWDNDHQLHPDERWIFMVVSGANGHPALSWPTSIQGFLSRSSPLNPHFFAYGSLPFYLLSALAATVQAVAQHVPGMAQWAAVDSYGGLPLLARGLSATLDLVSVCLVFMLARRIYGYWAGVVAMAFSACTVLEIQLSHFYAVDTVLLPLCLFVLFASVQVAQDNSRRAYLLGGLAMGAALATKTTALLLVIPFAAAAVLQAWNADPMPSGGTLSLRLRQHYLAVAENVNQNLQRVLVAYLIAGFAFVVLEPYAVIDRTQLVQDIAQQTQFLVSNDPPFVVPFTIQYAHTIPYIFQIQNLLFWSLGLPLALASFAGIVFVSSRALTGRFRGDEAVLLLWIVPYFLFVGRFFAKYNRYMLPITPVLSVLAAGLLVWLVTRSRSTARILAIATLAGVAGGSFLYSLAYMNVYAHPNTRVAASRWIFDHIPTGSTIAVEGDWDDPLPMDEMGHSGAVYRQVKLNLYDPDNQAKVQHIVTALNQAQYLVMSSERMIGSIPKLPERYPMTIRYYDLLFAGRLNYRLVREFQQHPQLGPITVQDYSADESFHVYDHPHVYVFQRTKAVAPARLQALLSGTIPAATSPTASLPVRPQLDARLMLTSADWSADQLGPTMDTMFPPGGFAMQHPALVWLLFLEILGIISFPLVFLVFGNLQDRGFAIAKTIGLLVVGYLVWIAVRAHLAAFDRNVILVAIISVALASAVMGIRTRKQIVRFMRDSWRQVVAGELVFLSGFALFVLLRMWYPDLGHQFSPVSTGNPGDGRMGEKQMELAFISAIARSRVYPPLDPFFAHGYINYYYYGFALVTMLCRLTQIAPATGFNLAVATFFALLVANVHSVASSVTRRVSVGVLAAVFVGFMGNLNGAWQVIRGLMQVATIHSSVPLVGGILNVVSGLAQVFLARQQLPAFDFWESTRIIPPVGLSISEFPFFTYLFADLHPHLIAFPFTAALIALALDRACGSTRTRQELVVSVVLGAITLGALAVTNPWDFPTYALLVAAGSAIGVYVVRRRFAWQEIWRAAMWLSALFVLSGLLYLPFKHDYRTVFVTGLGLTRDIPASALTGSAATAQQMRDVIVTPLRVYLEHFGLFFFVLLSYLLVLLYSDFGIGRLIRRRLLFLRFAVYYREQLPRVRHAALIGRRMRSVELPAADGSILLGLAILVGGLALLRYFLLAFISAVLGLVIISFLRLLRTKGAAELFVHILIAFALALCLGTQVFFVRDWLSEGAAFRMNTIFKFYNQAWIMFGIAGACALYFLMERITAEDAAVVRGPDTVARHRIPVDKRLGNATQAKPYLIALSAHAPMPSGAVPIIHADEVPNGVEHEPAAGDERDGRLGIALPLEMIGRTLKRPAGLFSRWPIWSFCFLMLMIAALVYTYAGTVSRETYRQTWLPENSVPFTLDGSAFMRVAYPGDYAGIRWLNAHVTGAPVIAEADDAYYNWRSRVSMFTGLPDIVNGAHEAEQRYADELDPTSLCMQTRSPDTCTRQIHARADDVKQLYASTSTKTAWRVLHAYNVKYIFVGFSERQIATPSGLGKFSSMVGHGLNVVFSAPGVTIYRIAKA